MTSPSTILVTAVAGAAAIALGAPIVAIAGVCIAAYGVKVAASTLGRDALAEIVNPPVGVSGLRDPFRSWVHAGLAAKRRYLDRLKLLEAGPLADRLADTAGEIDDVLGNLARSAKRAQALDDYLRTEAAQSAAAKLATARRRLAETVEPELRAERETIVASYAEQARVTERFGRTFQIAQSRIESTLARLEQLSIQLDEVALDFAESSPGANAAGVESLVADLHSVHAALAELEAPEFDAAIRRPAAPEKPG